MNKPVVLVDDFYVFECPHCSGCVIVQKSETCCCIFRHASYKDSGQQIGPHTSQSECERLQQEGLVRGCAKPFRFVHGNPLHHVEPCGYI